MGQSVDQLRTLKFKRMRDASGRNEDVKMDVWVLGAIVLKMRISRLK